MKTMEAINRLENALVAKLENHLDLEADDIPDSDEEVKHNVWCKFALSIISFIMFLANH